jgi:hypothetical protein
MNFILRYIGTGKPDLEQITAVLELHEVKIADDSLLPKSALLKADETSFTALAASLDANWELIPEKIVKVPDTKKKIRKP